MAREFDGIHSVTPIETTMPAIAQGAR